MSFISDYLIYSTKNEAPPMFHVWAGYATLSAAIGRRIWLPRGEHVIYPNIYVLLVGSAGCGKSTALQKSKRMLAELGNIPISFSVETPEGLCRYIAGDPNANPPIPSPCMTLMKWPDGHTRETHNMTIMANEFIDFISKNQEGWTGMLNNIYDEDRYDYRTKGKGEDVLVGPYIVILGAIPTEVSKKLQREEIITTGFARRTFMQYGERMFDNPLPDPIFTEVEADAKTRCLERLRQVQKLSGALVRTPEAVAWWHNWYKNHSISLMKKATPATQGWLSSKPDQVNKLAILNSISNRDSLEITAEDFELGLAYIEEMEKSFHMVFGGVGRNELASVSVKIFEYLNTVKTPIGYKMLCARFFSLFSAGKALSELSEVLRHLTATGQLTERFVQVGTLSENVYATPAAWALYDEKAKQKPSDGVPNG